MDVTEQPTLVITFLAVLSKLFQQNELKMQIGTGAGSVSDNDRGKGR